MSNININGKSYIGNSLIISNGKVIVDGKDVSPESKTITIQVDGNIAQLNVDNANKVSVIGNVEKLSTMSADVEVSGMVKGNISTMSGDVECGDVHGGISTMSGNVKHSKKH